MEKAAVSYENASLEKEWLFLCACASPGCSKQKIRELLKVALRWEYLLELAEEHSVVGVMAVRLREADYAEVPDSAREALQSRIRAQHLFALSMAADLFHILQEFSAAGIETLLVKGPLISLLAYGDPAIRNYVDLDLLVRHKDILAATQRMEKLGFESDVPLSTLRADKIPGEYLFKWPGTRRIIELHTERTFRYYPLPMRVEDLFARQRRVALDGREVPGLSLEDEFVLNCIHGAKHFWERLMWVADIAAVVARHAEMDWPKAQQAARDVGAERMLHLGLQLAENLLQVRVPAAMRNAVKQDQGVNRLAERAIRWLPQVGLADPPLRERVLFRMGMRGGGVRGALYLFRLSLSPTEEDWVEGAEERRSWIWDALRRPFRLLKKYGGGDGT
jgi:hypothetical protein